MFLFKLFPLCWLLLFTLSQASALQVDMEAVGDDAIFGIQFPEETRAFFGHANRVQSISIQDYLTASFRVTELNIVNQGSALLRIYYSRPLRPGELQKALAKGAQAAGVPGGNSIMNSPISPQAEALAERAKGVSDAITGTEVLKEYPTATHAHTIEYRVGSRQELLALHQALVDHWTREPVSEDDDSEDPERLSLGGTVFTVE